jgi:hypothetical protein
VRLRARAQWEQLAGRAAALVLQEPATIAALLVQGYPRHGYAVALQRALHGPFPGASPSPRGLWPQSVNRGLRHLAWPADAAVIGTTDIP